MYSDELKFLEFLNHYIETDNGKYYESIEEISKSKGNNEPLVKSDTKILNFEKMVTELFKNKVTPSVVDGLYFNFDKNNELNLFFIEFKGDKLNRKTWKKYFNDNIYSLPNNICNNQQKDCPIQNLDEHTLEKVYNQYSDDTINQLKVKPIESILISIPTLYNEYLGIKNSQNDLLSNFYKCNIFIVYAKDSKNDANNKLSAKFDLKNKYKLYKKSGLINDYEVLSNEEFEENVIPRIQKFPMNFLGNILKIIYKLKENKIEKPFKDYIFENLDFELKKEKIDLSNNKKWVLYNLIKQL